MNAIINFETAKLLKEKGFNEKHTKIYNTLGELWNSHYSYMTNDNVDSGACCVAPTIAEVVMWLYEKYGIWVSITTLKPIAFMPTLQSTTENGYKILGSDKTLSYKATPIEAYQHAISYILKNLI